MAGRQLPSLPKMRKDAVTRRLCASVHLDADFAHEADRRLTGDGLNAMGPALGINLVALARHARVAVLHRAALDRRLAWLFAAGWVTLLVGLVALVKGHGPIAMTAVYGPVAVLAAAWWLVHHDQARARAAAQGVYRSQDKAENLAPAVETEAEARLHDLKRANVIPYTDSAERTNPFVGSGDKIKETLWQPIDVSRPADSPTGGKLTVRPFDAVDLHTYVAREMEGVSGLDGLRARNRLYVIGSNALHLPDLLPDRTRRPVAQIPRQLVQAGLQSPGAGMRTYLCLERVGEGGRTIVSMYLRARLHRPSLTWEVAAYAIPPLHGRFHRVDHLPVARAESWWSLVSYATTHVWPELRGASRRLRARRRYRRETERALTRTRREIKERHLVYDYGAFDSLRESLGDWEQAGYSEKTDAQDFLFRLQQGVLVATERFLQDHNVDTGSFDKAQQIISTQTYNISGDINGPSNIGNQGQITMAGGQPQHGQGGGGHPGAGQGGGP
ncbi:hypothetical protein ACJWDR_11390 [Streptomyces tauricus]|uniref:hypothetical protein n=1 Tax=Streptomyces tauricus TaxID=68274 RepID=UPI00387F1149